MSHKKVVPGDRLKIPAKTWNALIDLLVKKVLGRLPKVTNVMPMGCVRAYTESSVPSIPPFTPVSWGGTLTSWAGYPYRFTSDPLIEVSTNLIPRGNIGITQTGIKTFVSATSQQGYVRTHGVSWVKVSEDAYDDYASYGCTHLNIYPGIGLRGSFAGPLRVLARGDSPYLQVSFQDYYPSTILAATTFGTPIPAKSGLLPGKASCELVYQDPRTEELVYSGASVDIYNSADAEVADDVLIQAKIEGFGGRYFVDWEQCPTSIS